MSSKSHCCCALYKGLNNAEYRLLFSVFASSCSCSGKTGSLILNDGLGEVWNKQDFGQSDRATHHPAGDGQGKELRDASEKEESRLFCLPVPLFTLSTGKFTGLYELPVLKDLFPAALSPWIVPAVSIVPCHLTLNANAMLAWLTCSLTQLIKCLFCAHLSNLGLSLLM